MRLYTIGYGNQGFRSLLERLEDALRMVEAVCFVVFDVRARRGSWCRDLSSDMIDKNFSMQGHDYRWCPALGNNGDAENIKLSNERVGLAELKLALEKLSVSDELVLLCAEHDHEQCHRSHIADLVQRIWGAEVIHL